MDNARNLIAKVTGLAVVAVPVAYGLAMFDDAASSSAAWAGMLIAVGAGAVGSRTSARRCV